ncbi:TonB-dependent receptor [Xanthobacter sp. TB0136]|uniref:TonB-dependent receptor n=1 Tax=Xanthobacter sp. TB0136 TaxID=3459177 RepID=UPI00403981BC
MNFKGRASLLGAATVAASLAAQVPAKAEEALGEEVVTLDAIEVTARKRSELVQDVPIAVSVVEGRDIPADYLDPGPEIARSTPNFNFVDFAVPGGNFGNIRGIGPLGSPLNSLDNTVGFAVDGVPTSSFGFAPTLMDVQRVEVLRGPQGTLFGRNALGGMVNVINTPADGRGELRLNAEYGTNGYGFVEGIAGGWLLPGKIAGRGVLRFQNYDGDIPNPLLGKDEGAARVQAGRGTLAFMPDETLNISFTGGFDYDWRNNPLYLWRESPAFPVSGVDLPQYGSRQTGYGNMTITKEFNSFLFTSITGYQHIKLKQLNDATDAFLFGEAMKDYGMTAIDFMNPLQDLSDVDEVEGIFSQELRISSLAGSAISWVAGLSYFRSDYEMDRLQTSLLFASNNGTYNTHILSQTWAAFGDVSVPITDRLTFSGGLRLAHDMQGLNSLYVSNGYPGTVPLFHQVRSYDDTYLTGRAALSWHWNEDVMSYVSIARGYASGGFERYTLNAEIGALSPSFLPSKVLTYEFGNKALLLDRRLELNGSIFYNNVIDGQMVSFDAANFVYAFSNQDYFSYGAELEARFHVNENWSLSGGLGLTKSSMVNVDPASGSGAADGNQVPNSPEVTANVGLQYRQPATLLNMNGAFTASAVYQYVGAREADVQNSFRLNAYQIINSQIGFEHEGNRFYVFGRNLMDERPEFFGSTFSSTARSVMIGRGRILGVGASLSW